MFPSAVLYTLGLVQVIQTALSYIVLGLDSGLPGTHSSPLQSRRLRRNKGVVKLDGIRGQSTLEGSPVVYGGGGTRRWI